jgi:hypothetical protein
LQNDLDSIKSLVGASAANSSQAVYSEKESDTGGEDGRGSMANGHAHHEASDGGSEDMGEDGPALSPGLTTSVWVISRFTQPHPKLFLHMIKKMFKKGLIDEEEKGRLKEWVLSGEPVLEEILGKYEGDGNIDRLFGQIRGLLASSDN